MTIQAVNPATGATISSHEEMAPTAVQDAVRQADEAFSAWRNTSFAERKTLMHEAAVVLRRNSDDYARLMALEMGKPIRQGRTEIDKCAWVCEYYADRAESFLQPEPAESDASKSFVVFRPLGVVLAVMPWNFPFWQVFRFAAPALMAGNVGLLKHASNVPGCALAIEEVFRQAGFPENAFRTLIIGSRQVQAVVENPLVRAATLTGSAPAGRSVASAAGQVLKKTVLELGGSDPYVILEDADLSEAVPACVSSRLINSGQSCISAKRFIVVESQRRRFEEMFVEDVRTRKVGHPLEEETEVGPMARHDLRDELHDQVRRSVEAGARCLIGGEIPGGTGAFYPPTVLSNVRRGMAAYDEETFGPVAAIISARDEEEAIQIANDSSFGLGAAVFTRDVARGEHIAAERLEAGCCFVNTFVKSDPRLPFGGVKESGYGRELSHYGIKEFVNIKTLYVK